MHGPKGMGVIVNRIRKLITMVKVVSPVTHYAQKLGATAITGNYAVLAPPRQKHLRDLMILRLRFENDMGRAKTARPDVVTWARWLHLRFHEMTVSSIGVMNYGIDIEGAEWSDDVPYDENVVRGVLTGLTGAAQSGWGYPSPGSYCDSCLTLGCTPEGK
jgi:hypothetical protein